MALPSECPRCEIIRDPFCRRGGGRPFNMTPAKIRLAMAAIGQKETKVGKLCKELGITRQTLSRHVSPTGELRPDGQKLLSEK